MLGNVVHSPGLVIAVKVHNHHSDLGPVEAKITNALAASASSTVCVRWSIARAATSEFMAGYRRVFIQQSKIRLELRSYL
jgi:hypothetical protein